MSKKEAKKIQKQIDSLTNLLTKLEIRPCKGDKDIKQKEIEIADLKDKIHSLKNERDGHLYTRSKPLS
jgi:peptidoglycan hydrolase CwlO-like protein